MKCPDCPAEGKTSKVYSTGSTSTLLGGGGPYWDEQGVRHSHDPNKRTSGYRCSNGHTWALRRLSPCPSCDYGHDEPELLRFQ